MKKKENQRIALTKRLLKEHLLQAMSKKDIQDITVSELCESADMNRSTFYRHYGKPADVLFDIELDMIEDLASINEEKIAGKNCPINRRVEMLCAYLKEHEQVIKLILRSNETSAEFERLVFNAVHIKSIHEQAVAAIENPDSKKLAMTFLTSGTYSMIRQWILEDIPKSAAEMGDTVSQMIMQMGKIR